MAGLFVYQQTLLQQRQPAHYFVPLNNNWVGFVILMGCGIGHVAMKIVADQDITHVSEFFSACGELRLKQAAPCRVMMSKTRCHFDSFGHASECVFAGRGEGEICG